MTIDTTKWNKITFGEIAKNLTKTVKDPLSDNLKRYVGLEHLEPGNIHIKSWGNVANGTTFTRVFRKGQVLFGKRRAYQKKIAVAEFEGVCSGDILVFEVIEDKLLPELLPFIVQSDRFFEYAIKTSAGSLSPRTKFKDLAKFSFRLPKLDKQKPIADLLWSVDEVEQSYIKYIDTLSKVLNSFIINLIPRPNEKAVLLGDYVNIEKGLTYTSSDYSSESEGNILVNLKSFEKYGGFNKNGIKYYKGNYKKNHVLKRGDLIIANTDITRNGDVIGYPVIVPDFGDRIVLFTMDVSALRIKNTKKMLAKFLYYLLKTKWAHWYMYVHSSGTTVLHLDVSAIPKMKIPYVDIDRQKAICSELVGLEGAIEKYKEHTLLIATLKTKLLTKIFG